MAAQRFEKRLKAARHETAHQRVVSSTSLTPDARSMCCKGGAPTKLTSTRRAETFSFMSSAWARGPRPGIGGIAGQVPNLPAKATSFIGRQHERAKLRTKLAAACLVSLVGPGGPGPQTPDVQVGAVGRPADQAELQVWRAQVGAQRVATMRRAVSSLASAGGGAWSAAFNSACW